MYDHQPSTVPPAFRPLNLSCPTRRLQAIASTYPDKQGTATKVGYKQDAERD